ncbi:hypothetical protein KSP40_PGU004294 [Platanthera guangdongensis]|uniref:AB hydrolase-1 domain-containing protein n=1 Tax=Platanthera guangdongensis TaxID=2320717 RepID=A0ABR2MHL9_9ASPA
MEELGVHLVSYDRAGYGESDPNPKRSRRSEASDIEELADTLKLGSRFYLIGYSLGGHGVWASIKYIPGRLSLDMSAACRSCTSGPCGKLPVAGVSGELVGEAYRKQEVGDQWALRVAYYTPWLLHWWMSQPWLPTSTVVKATTHLPNQLDAQIRDWAVSSGILEKRRKLATQQGIHESYYRDMMVMFGPWEFDPMDLHPPPFPVHLWQGDEDGLVPVTLQRYICKRLGWIEYHELPATGHYLTAVPGFGNLLLKTLLAGTSS